MRRFLLVGVVAAASGGRGRACRGDGDRARPLLRDPTSSQKTTAGSRSTTCRRSTARGISAWTRPARPSLSKDTFHYREVVTNPDYRPVVRDPRPRRVPRDQGHPGRGDRVRVRRCWQAGQPFVIEDAEGNVIVRDRGLIRSDVSSSTRSVTVSPAASPSRSTQLRGPRAAPRLRRGFLRDRGRADRGDRLATNR